MMLIICVLLICLLIIKLCTTQSSSALYFGHSLTITKDEQLSPLLPNQLEITQKGNAYVVWVDNDNIYFRSSQDNENKFGPKIVLSQNNNSAFSPQIAATENGNVYIVWIDKNSTTGDSNIVFRSSNDSGENFAERKELGGIDVLPSSAQIAATENGNVYIVWIDIDSTSGDSNILFRSSNDSGENFAERKKLRGGKGLAFSAQIAATEKGDVYVVMLDKNRTTGDSNIVFRKSINNGQNFDSRIYLNLDKDKLSKSFSPQIAATEKGKVYVVWIEDHVKFKEILDKDNLSGETISLSNKTSSSSPQVVATEKGDVYVVWMDKNSTMSEESLLFKRISEFYFDRNS